MKYECGVSGSKAGVEGKSLVSSVHSHSGLLIFSNAFFEEKKHFTIRLIISIHLNRLQILLSEAAKGNQESVGAELDEVAHHG